MKVGDRIILPGTGEHGTIRRVVPKADGLWAEQFYEVALDGNDLCEVTLHETALAAETSA